MSFQIKKLNESVIKVSNGRSPKYALTTNAFDVGDKIHIWEVDNFGKHSAIATLRPLTTGRFFVEKIHLCHKFLWVKKIMAYIMGLLISKL